MSAPPLCRFCRAPLTRTFLDLGEQPLANSYLTAEQLAAGGEPVYPLHTRVCDACFLVQADHDVPAEAIFDAEYAYFSSFSPGWVEHARRYAEARPGELDRIVLDHSKATAILGWTPQYALDEGLKHTVAYFRSHP